jgi:hypothetical protein
LDGLRVTLASLGGAFHVTDITSPNKPAAFYGIPEGRYQFSAYRPYGLDSIATATVDIVKGKTLPLTVTADALPYLNLDSSSFSDGLAPGWKLMPLPPEDAAQAENDDSPASPDYPDAYIDPTFGVEWDANVDVPGDIGAGDPSDPTRPVQDDSVFWYRLTFDLPSEWSPYLADRGATLGGYVFEKADRAFINGHLAGRTASGAVRRYAIPGSWLVPGGPNVLAIQGRQTFGSAGIVSGDVILSVAPKTPPAPLRGDVNGDGRIGVDDVTLALRIAVGLETPSTAQVAAGDLLRHGRIDIQDTNLLLGAVVGTTAL